MRHKAYHRLLFRSVGGQEGGHIAVLVFGDLLHTDAPQFFHHHIGEIEERLRAGIALRLRVGGRRV